MRSRWLLCGLALAAIAALLGGWAWVTQQADRDELRQSQREVADEQYNLARRRLVGLVERRPSWGEALYQLGLCEEARGQAEAALAAWSRVAPGSPAALKAALGRARVLMNAGRFGPAEAILVTLPRARRPESDQVRRALELLFLTQGRLDEVRDLLVESWDGATDPAGLLLRHYRLDHSAFPVDYVRKTLDGGDPDDDRVWLGQANLAIWSGRFEEAAGRLEACARRRPDDPTVWRARLELARSTGDRQAFLQAASRLPIVRFTPAEVLRLRAWLAGQQGDPQLEGRSLQVLVEQEPGNIPAWDRLAELAVLAGRTAEAVEFHRKKESFNQLREQYKTLFDRDDRADHAAELARLAEQLGRPIEARGWSLIASGRAAIEPLRPAEGRSGLASQPGARAAATLESRLADLLPATPERSSPSVPGPVGSALEFVDDARAAGLNFVHDNGHIRRNPPPPEAMCGGVGLLDYDGDGWLDVYVVQAGPFPPRGTASQAVTADHEQDARAADPEGDRLFRNRGDGRFEDVTSRAGIAAFPRGYGHGVTVADWDNDGRPDLFLTRWRSYALYRNRSDGTFEDVTIPAGLGGDRDWPTSAAFADLDGDGDLDLYVCHYLAYDPRNPRRCEHLEAPSRHDCDPLDFPALPDHVFRNDGGRFVDVTGQAGFVDPNGRGLGVVAAHLDDDDRIDLYVANDMTANYLFRNRGEFQFEESGAIAGAAASADGGYKAGMGIACGDLDGDGRVDLAVTNYFGESTTFYRNLGGGFFADHTAAVGLAAPTRRLLGFGIAFLDADNDGWLDVLSTNGHVLDARPQFPWTMPLQFLQGGPGGRLTDVSERAGAPFLPLHLGRGLAVGDLDNDGRLDALVVVQNEPLISLYNRTSRPGHFLTLCLEGTRSNRDAIGARVTVGCGGRRQVAQRFGGGSYQSASDPRLHFGLGDESRVEYVEVRWPSGHVDRHTGLLAECAYRLREGAGPVVIRDQSRQVRAHEPPEQESKRDSSTKRTRGTGKEG
jgi:tetratricopeptide (TPR) repeat protein